MFLETAITTPLPAAEPQPQKRPGFFDSPEKLAALMRMYRAGMKMRDIAIELGTNKNTVLGKITRLRATGKLDNRAAPTPATRQRVWWTDERLATLRQCNTDGMTLKETARFMRCHPNRISRKADVLELLWTIHAHVSATHPTPRQSPYVARQLTDEPRSLAIPLLDVSSFECRWPTTQTTCCGHTTVTQPRRKPYCSYHCSVSYRVEPNSQPNDEPSTETIDTTETPTPETPTGSAAE